MGMANEDEHDSWSPRVGKEVLKSLTAKEVWFRSYNAVSKKKKKIVQIKCGN